MVKLCEYGCGREAKHQFKNGKWCCSISCNSCSAKRSSGFKHLQKTKEKIGVKNKLTIEKIQKIYPIFTKEEEMRYNPDKPGEQEIQVHCKYNRCDNSKENNGWFTPSKGQLSQRFFALEHKYGNDGRYFYCSEECKQNCCLYYFKTDPNIQKEFEKYNKKAWKETNKTLKKFKIVNIELRGYKYGYELDHKYTVYDGFKNNVDQKIIGHYKNLECIPSLENSKKGRNSSITLKKLLKEIKYDFIRKNKSKK